MVHHTFGADMFGTLLPELRKAMRFDKADPYALFGVYVGNTRLSPMWKLAYVGGIKYFGAGMIDEVKVFMNAPIAGSSDSFDRAEVEAEVRGSGEVFAVNGELLGPLESASSGNEVMVPPPASSAPFVPLSLTRPRRGAAAIQVPVLPTSVTVPSSAVPIAIYRPALARKKAGLDTDADEVVLSGAVSSGVLLADGSLIAAVDVVVAPSGLTTRSSIANTPPAHHMHPLSASLLGHIPTLLLGDGRARLCYR